jgi:uncharacterized protein (TIGR03067 family)
MRPMALALMTAALLLLGAAAPQEGPDSQAPPDRQDANDAPARLRGTWTVVSAEDGGRKAPPDAIKHLKLTVAADAITYTVGDKTTRWAYKLDAGKKPAWIDLVEDGRASPGIYELDNDGDTLKICFSEVPEKGRPTAFESKPNSPNDVLIVLKREKQDP